MNPSQTVTYMAKNHVKLNEEIVQTTTTEHREEYKNNLTIISKSYQPGPYDVTCGRGKGNYNKPGNKKFREIVFSHVNEYVSCKTKFEKSLLLDLIVDKIKEQNNGNTHFLRYNTSERTWSRMSSEETREKVGHAMREAMTTHELKPSKIQKTNQELMKHKELLTSQRRIFISLLRQHGEIDMDIT